MRAGRIIAVDHLHEAQPGGEGYADPPVGRVLGIRLLDLPAKASEREADVVRRARLEVRRQRHHPGVAIEIALKERGELPAGSHAQAAEAVNSGPWIERPIDRHAEAVAARGCLRRDPWRVGLLRQGTRSTRSRPESLPALSAPLAHVRPDALFQVGRRDVEQLGGIRDHLVLSPRSPLASTPASSSILTSQRSTATASRAPQRSRMNSPVWDRCP